MKTFVIPVLIIFASFFFSCKNHSLSSHSTADSLTIVLKTQIHLFKYLPSFTPHTYSISDTLSHNDSVLFQYLHHNYSLAISVMDSIQKILPQLHSEADTLLKLPPTNDSAVIRRLSYLSQLHHSYYEEYIKANTIAQQNDLLLKALLSKQP